MNKTLLIVDVQNDFVTGAFANEDAKERVPAIVNFINYWEGKIAITLDQHKYNDDVKTIEEKTLPKHCDTFWGVDLVEEIRTALKDSKVYTFSKDTFSISDRTNYYLVDRCFKNADEIHIVGFVTDICVISNALMLRNIFPYTKIIVHSDLCAGTSSEAHEAALTVMRNCLIEVI